MDEPENLYNKISEFNKWDSIFPCDDQLNKVKLNDELIDRIFNEYHFKDLKKNSTAKCIVRNIYNAFFNKNVIKSKNLNVWLNVCVVHYYITSCALLYH